jgi:hypothetical protein
MFPVFRFPLLLISVMIVAVACIKPIDIPSPAVNGIIALNLGNGTISASSVDSVEVYFKANNEPARRYTMTVVNGQWQIRVPELPAAMYNAEIRVYQRKTAANDKESFIYALTNNVQIPVRTDLLIAGPTGTLNEQFWNKRLMRHDAQTNTTLIIGLQFRDPFFELRVAPGKRFSYFYIDRIANMREGNSNRQVGGDAFEKDEVFGSPGIVSNTTAFASLATQMAGKSWNHAQILMLLVDDSGQDHTYYYQYEK